MPEMSSEPSSLYDRTAYRPGEWQKFVDELLALPIPPGQQVVILRAYRLHTTDPVVIADACHVSPGTVTAAIHAGEAHGLFTRKAALTEGGRAAITFELAHDLP